MLKLPGYTLEEKVYESTNSVVYRGVSERHGAVYVKVLPEELPSPDRLTRMRREFRMTRALEDPRVIRALGLETLDRRLALVVEDFGGVSLDRALLRARRDLATLLRIAVRATEAVESVHARKVIHKDVAPANLVWNAETGALKLIDFGISSELSHESPSVLNPEVIEGTLAFMSPEQTGRMNRVLDYRTDLYSLGATLYWVFSGSLPFSTSDPLELAHAHLARMPPPPHELNAAIPEAVSRVVLKLMAKNAEKRYQSAAGARADLALCLDHWLAKGAIPDFALGGLDFSRTFSIPQRLYGRTHEVERLLEDFERAASGEPRMTLVAGYSGIGKSALVHEVHKPIVARRGHFCSGKFDQFRRNVPFASLTQALQSLVRQLLSEPEDRLERWREAIQRAVGINGQLILDVIPEAGLILGPQQPVAELGPLESQNRFNRVLADFIRVFAAAEHPLTLFLDDLQWADAASLALIQKLMTDDVTRHLFLVGAYRDNEVDPTHPLVLTLNAIRQQGTPVTTITLGPLAFEHVAQLVADTLGCAAADVQELSRICVDKTRGNPFFLRRFLHAVHEGGGFSLEPETGSWNWDQAEVKATGITDNVVELMSQKIRALPAPTQRVLQLAACIGATFALNTLSIVSELTTLGTAEALWQALQEGLVIPLGGDYKFLREHAGGALGNPSQVRYRWLHDRVQQAAYALIADDRKEVVHHQLGQRMLANLSPEERDEKLFEIAGHLNLGAGQRVEQAERDELAELNLEVGRKAIASVAFRTAQRFLDAGLELLGADAWARRYRLTLDLHTENARATSLIPDFLATQHHFEEVREHAADVIDLVRACEYWVTACAAQTKVQDGLAAGFRVLSDLGYPFPDEPSEEDLGLYVQRARDAIGERSVDELLAMPPNPDAREVAALRLCMIMAPPSYIAAPGYFPLFGLKAVELSARNGDTGASAFAYVLYATLLCGVFEAYDDGMRFAELGQRLIAKHDAREYAARVAYVPNCFVVFWKKHLRVAWAAHPESYRLGLENGDHEFAAWSIMKHSQQGFFLGLPLDDWSEEARDHVAACFRVEQATSGSYGQATLQAMLGLMGQSEDPCLLVGEAYDEREAEPRYREANEAFGLCNLYLTKTLLCYLFDRWEDALAQEPLAAPHAAGMLSLYHVAVWELYQGLSRLAVARTAEEPRRSELLAAADGSIAKLAGWAAHCPENYLHKHRLLAGERALCGGDFAGAEALFLEAIRAAEVEGYAQEQALGHELLGRSWLERGEPDLAHRELSRARHLYAVWGARAKVAQLETKHGLDPSSLRYDLPRSSTTTRLGELDLDTVLKASQAISSQVQREGLLRTMLAILIENAGARTGALIREGSAGPLLEARGSEDGVEVFSDLSALGFPLLPQSVVNLVRRTREPVVIDDVRVELDYEKDPYLSSARPRSLLCLPVEHQGKLVACLYLENDLTPGAFTKGRVALLRMLLSQVAISLENARLYGQMEALVEQRTRELEETQEQLARSLLEQKLKAEGESRAKSRFLATMSHEIRTPLNAVIGLTRLCLKGDLDPKARDYLLKIDSASASLFGIVRSVLNLSRIEAGRVELERSDFDLEAALGRVSDVVADSAANKGLGFPVRIDPEIPRALVGDPLRLGQVLINLTSNAVKFTHEGEVELRVALASASADAVRLRFVVRDTGIGIADETLPRLFAAFTQADGSTTREYGGFGLGLRISSDLVTLMGGEIEVQSELGVGSEFSFEVEFGRGAERQLQEEPSEEDFRQALDGARVLVAEDEEINQLIAREILEDAGMRVDLVRTGREALEALNERTYDVVLMDVNMPELDGYEVTRRVRREAGLEELPILAMTADAMQGTRERCLSAGMNAYVTKPIEVPVLLETLARWVSPARGSEPEGDACR